MVDWQDLDAELGKWERPATLWWRDDDAAFHSPQLDRLLDLAAGYALPLLLAVIPAKLDETLVERLAGEKLVWVCQHGYDHRNNARPGQRKIELGGSLEPGQAHAQLAAGRKMLQEKFPLQYLDILVPPWNRLDRNISLSLSRSGYRRLSVLGPRRNMEEHLPQINVHVDIMDFKKGTFVGRAGALASLIRHLRAKRRGEVATSEPTGVMTHHLIQDEAAWRFLHDLSGFALAHDKLRWVGGSQLFEV